LNRRSFTRQGIGSGVRGVPWIGTAQLEAALEGAGGATFAVGWDGAIRSWPPSVARFFGLAGADAVGRPGPQPVGLGQQRLQEALSAAARGEQTIIEVVFARCERQPVPAMLVIGPARDEQGVSVGAAVAVVPMDAHAADTAERRLATVLDSIPAPTFFKDARGVYQGCNPAFETYLGRPRSEIIGLSPEDVAPPHLARVYREADLALMKAGTTQVYETRVQHADGTERQVLFTKGVLRDASGAVDGIVGTMLDITDRKRAEEALRRSEERLRLVLESVGEILWDWDVADDALTVSSNFEAMTGWPPREIASMRAALRLLESSERPRLRRVLGPNASDVEHRVRTASGQWRWLRTRVKVVERSARGLPRRVVGVSADVTERKQIEESLLVADRLASLGALAAGVGHELNNPLAYVLTNLRFALNALAEQKPEARDAACEEIVSALRDALDGAERMRTVVCDLRAISRQDDDSKVGTVDVEATLDVSVRLVRNEILQRARLQTEYLGLPPARGNAARLGQVFLNLLVNAYQAIEPGAVDANLVRVTTRLAGSEVVVAIQDTGCGIDPRVLPRIFDPFFTTKPVGIGTGLGLAISQRIAKSSGGRLEVESAPGAGSTFRLILPVASSIAAPT